MPSFLPSATFRLACATLAACSPLLASHASAAPYAEQVYLNGRIYTVDAHNSVQQAVAIRHGRIMAVGSNARIRALAGPATRRIDLQQRMMMPGIVDGHMHPLEGGAQLRSCSLDYAALGQDAIRDKIRHCLQQRPLPAGAWLEVQAWSRQEMPDGTDLSAAVLDSVDSRHPIIVTSSDHHTLAANSAAMRLAGIDANSKDPANGKIARLANGQPGGIFEDGAMALLTAAIPPLPAAQALARDREDALAALNALNAQGVTSFLEVAASENSLRAFSSLQRSGQLSARAHFAPAITPEQGKHPQQAVAAIVRLQRRYDQPPLGSAPGITLNTAKVFMDGVIQAPAQTAALHVPYLQNKGSEAQPDWRASDQRGKLYFDQQSLNRLLLALARHNINLHLHTDGDRAVTVALNAVARLRARYPDKALRPALAHNELITPADYPRYRQLNALPVLSFQWGKPVSDTGDAVKPYIGTERFAYLETAGKFQQAGATIVFGSDWPVDPLNEWLALQVAVTRSNPDPAASRLGRLGDDPGLTVAQAIRAFTINAAYSLGREKTLGSIEPGKLADLIVLDRNLLQIAPSQLGQVKVLSTVLGGREVYRAM